VRSCHRHPRERAFLRDFVLATYVDEGALSALVKPLLKEQERVMLEDMQHMTQAEALQSASMKFNDIMASHCMRALEERDTRVERIANDRGAEALRAFRLIGALEPPWVEWKLSTVRYAVKEFVASLHQTRPNREYSLRARVVRTVTEEKYSQQRMAPHMYALNEVRHVITQRDVEKLRAGSTLVLDPNPPLLSDSAMRSAHADLVQHVRKGGVMLSHNPCNAGSYHGMLPISGAPSGLQK